VTPISAPASPVCLHAPSQQHTQHHCSLVRWYGWMELRDHRSSVRPPSLHPLHFWSLTPLPMGTIGKYPFPPCLHTPAVQLLNVGKTTQPIYSCSGGEQGVISAPLFPPLASLSPLLCPTASPPHCSSHHVCVRGERVWWGRAEGSKQAPSPSKQRSLVLLYKRRQASGPIITVILNQRCENNEDNSSQLIPF